MGTEDSEDGFAVGGGEDASLVMGLRKYLMRGAPMRLKLLQKKENSRGGYGGSDVVKVAEEVSDGAIVIAATVVVGEA